MARNTEPKTPPPVVPQRPGVEPEPTKPPSLLLMVLTVAAVVAVVILIFSALGYFLGKAIF